MGAPTTSGLPTLDFGVKKEDVLSTADLPKEEQQDIVDARNKALDALEARYAQPNLWKVASAFAKPQLGGFLASLGSASEALGENLEQQRAIAAPIAVERAKLAQMQSMMMKNERGANMVAELLGLGSDAGRQISSTKDLSSFLTPENIKRIPAAIGRLEAAGQNDFAKALKSAQDSYANTVTTRTGETELSAAEQRRIKEDQSYIPKFDDSLPFGSRESQDNLKYRLKATLAARGFDKDQLDSADLNQLVSMSKDAMEAQAAKRFEDMNVSSQDASNAKNRMLSLAESREIVAKPEIGKVLGLQSGQSALSAILGYIQNTNETTGTAMNKALAQLKIENQAAYDDFQVLAKLLTQDVSVARSAMQNPSVSSTVLASQSNPTAANTQAAILKMMDLMAHRESEKYREYLLKTKYQGDFSKLQASGDIERLHDQVLQERRDLARNPADARTLPSFYSLSSLSGRNNSQAPGPASPAAPAASQGSTNAPQNQRAEVARVLAERERQERAQNAPQ